MAGPREDSSVGIESPSPSLSTHLVSANLRLEGSPQLRDSTQDRKGKIKSQVVGLLHLRTCDMETLASFIYASVSSSVGWEQ